MGGGAEMGGARPGVQDSSGSCSADVCMVPGSSPVLQSLTPSPTPTPASPFSGQIHVLSSNSRILSPETANGFSIPAESGS